MRKLAALLAVFLVALPFSCSTESPSDSTVAGGGGGSCASKTQCDDTDIEQGCVTCAEVGPCLDELNRCHMSEDCLSYGQCIQACVQGDDECTITCANDFPEGSSDYGRLLQCVICEQCPGPCDGPGSGCAG